MDNRPIINVHTHIFNHKFIPDYAVDIKVRIPLRSIVRNRFLVNVLKAVTYVPFVKKDGIKRIISAAEIGLGNTQGDIFNTLDSYYRSWGDVRFVVLPMDMEQMGGGEAPSSYSTQLQEIIDLRQNKVIEKRLLPFVFIDPRRREFLSGQDVLNFAKRYIEGHKFMGIKLYPALGYFPFDEKLRELYAWCEQNEVPLLSHTIEGVIRYQKTGPEEPAYTPPAKYQRPWNTISYADKSKLQRNFTDPRNWELVLQEFPKLKINMAHYGTDSMDTSPDNMPNVEWYNEIRRIISNPAYPNAFADIAYSVHEPKLFKNYYEDANNPQTRDKVLFGTDYYVVQKTKTEDNIIKDFRAEMKKLDIENQREDESTFRQLAISNPHRYLDSPYFRAL